MPDLQRIYFQDPAPEKIMDRFLAINNDDRIIKTPIKDTDQFFLPPEL